MALIVRDILGADIGDDYTSAAYRLEYVAGCSFVIDFTETSATLGGAVKLQASNDAFISRNGNTDLTENSSATWVDIPDAADTITGSDTTLFNLTDAQYTAIRVVWTHSGGDGTMDIFFRAKDRSR